MPPPFSPVSSALHRRRSGVLSSTRGYIAQMMRLRRTAVLLVASIGFHLQMGASAAACMNGGTEQNAGMTRTSTDMPAMPGMAESDDAGAGTSSGNTGPCSSADLPPGCELMASCATTLLEWPPAQSSDRSIAAPAPRRLIVLAPVSRSHPPEPPPPRA